MGKSKLKIPEWQYPLYKKSDHETFLLLKKLATAKKYPEISGHHIDINNFLKLLVVSQKMKDYRQFRDIIIKALKAGEVDAKKLVMAGKKMKIPRGVDRSWAIFHQDKRLCRIADKFNETSIDFQGSRRQEGEFVLRFLLAQLLTDWRGPLLATLLESIRIKKIKLSRLNQLLKTWDYSKIFES